MTGKKLSFLSMLLLGLFLFSPASVVFAEPQAAQQESRIVTGRVVDAQGEPLIGVSVRIVGTHEGTITNFDGEYSIRVQGNNQVLQFSFVGFENQTQPANRSVINVILAEDLGLLGEVVVVGFGTQRRANLTGAVSTVDVERTLSDRPIGDVGRMLQGSVPGLNISVPTGELGADVALNIRGSMGSFQPGATPLILLDNVEIPNLTLVNPDDIESISILRDAAASAIFGTRAAFGVILITTRQGTATDRINVTYSNNFAWSSRATPINMATMDAVEYAWLSAQRVGQTQIGFPWMINAEGFERIREHYARYGIMGVNEPILYGRDWFSIGGSRMGIRLYDPTEHMLQDWAPSQTHNISISGRSGNTQYHVSLGYFHQRGLLRTALRDDFSRYNASTRITTQLHDRVTFRSGFMYSQRVRHEPRMVLPAAGADFWLTMYRWGPLMPFGVDQHGETWRSLAQEGADANIRMRQNRFMSYTAGLTINLTNNWTFTADYTYTEEAMLMNNPGTRFLAVDTWFGTAVPWNDDDGNRVWVNREGQEVDAGTPGAEAAWRMVPVMTVAEGAALDGIARSSRHHRMHTLNAFTTYNLRLQDIHELTFMAGTNIVAANGMSHWTERRRLLDFENPSFDRAAGVGADVLGGGADWWSSQVGFFGRINYVLNNRYLFEVNLRSDASSNFPEHLRWAWFPSASAGWIVTEEDFMQGLQPYLSFLRPRISYGRIGNQNVPNTLFLPTMSNVAAGWLHGSQMTNTLRTPALFQDDIGWEIVETLNLGLDARFFNNRLGLAFDWYQRDTRDALVGGPVLPFTAGAWAPSGNFAHLRTRGWEIAIDYNHRFRNGLGINILGTLSDHITYIHDFPDAIRGTGLGTQQRGANFRGQRVGNIWGYQTNGLFQWSDFELGHDGNLLPVWVNPTTGGVAFSPGVPGHTVEMNRLAGTVEDISGADGWVRNPNNPSYAPQLQTGAGFMFGPGDVRFVDRNGDGLINPGGGTVDNPGDMMIIGNSMPRFMYGLRIGADFRGFDFSMFWQGVGRRDLWGDGFLAVPGYNATDMSMPQAIAGNFWREDRTNAFFPRPFNMTLGPGAATDIANYHRSDRFLLNMAYLRLKNITVGYSLPQDILRHVHLSNARVHVSLENFLTFDNLNGLPIDPETVPGHNWDGAAGLNANRVGTGAPMMRQISVGLQVTL